MCRSGPRCCRRRSCRSGNRAGACSPSPRPIDRTDDAWRAGRAGAAGRNRNLEALAEATACPSPSPSGRQDLVSTTGHPNYRRSRRPHEPQAGPRLRAADALLILGAAHGRGRRPGYTRWTRRQPGKTLLTSPRPRQRSARLPTDASLAASAPPPWLAALREQRAIRMRQMDGPGGPVPTTRLGRCRRMTPGRGEDGTGRAPDLGRGLRGAARSTPTAPGTNARLPAPIRAFRGYRNAGRGAPPSMGLPGCPPPIAAEAEHDRPRRVICFAGDGCLCR